MQTLSARAPEIFHLILAYFFNLLTQADLHPCITLLARLSFFRAKRSSVMSHRFVRSGHVGACSCGGSYVGVVGRRCWFVVRCKPREDARALEHLRGQSLHCYAPTLKVEKLPQSRRIAVQEPRFPRYVFVQLDEVNDNWRRIRSTRVVAQLVHCHERLLPIDDRIIEGIRARLAVDQPCVPYLKAGERVVIIDGPFSDVQAIFLANDGKERLILLLNILHREKTLPFPVGSVRKARDP